MKPIALYKQQRCKSNETLLCKNEQAYAFDCEGPGESSYPDSSQGAGHKAARLLFFELPLSFLLNIRSLNYYFREAIMYRTHVSLKHLIGN